MSKLILGLFLLSISAAHATPLPQEFVKSEVIETKFVSVVPGKSFKDSKWKMAPLQTVRLFPQQTVPLNDALVNGKLAQAKPIEVKVRALYSPKELALWLEWKDEEKNLFLAKETAEFADGVAIQIPKVYGEGHRLPYIGMGDEKYPVLIFISQAMAKGFRNRGLSAHGFGSSQPANDGKFSITMEYDSAGKVWRALWSRALAKNDPVMSQGIVPVALAIWNGEMRERGGNKSLSAWKFLRFEKLKQNENYLRAISFGFHQGEVGDPAKGKTIVTTTCAGCHRVGLTRLASKDMAPDLTAIGGISTFGYLRDSLVEPNDIIVKNLNPQRHYSKGVSSDSRGSHPVNEAYLWYNKDERGQVVSKMPKFSNFSSGDVADIVAYLKKLDGSGEGTQ